MEKEKKKRSQGENLKGETSEVENISSRVFYNLMDSKNRIKDTRQNKS